MVTFVTGRDGVLRLKLDQEAIAHLYAMLANQDVTVLAENADEAQAMEVTHLALMAATAPRT